MERSIKTEKVEKYHVHRIKLTPFRREEVIRILEIIPSFFDLEYVLWKKEEVFDFSNNFL